MRRAILRPLWTLLILVALAASAIVLLAETERGTRFLFAQAEQLLPVRFTGVAGALGSRLRVDQVTVELEDREIVVADLALELRLFGLLFDNRLEIGLAEAGSVTVIERQPRRPAESPVELVLPFMPVEIELDRLAIARLRLGGLPEVAVRGAANWTAAGLVLRGVTIEGEALHAALAGTLGAGSRPTLQLTVDWTLPQAGWEGRGEFSGRVDELEIAHAASGPARVQVTGSANVAAPGHPVVDLQIEVDPVTAGEVAFDELAGRIAGTREALTLEARARVNSRFGAPFPVRATAHGAVGGPAAFDLRAEPLGGEVAASGTADWSETPVVTLAGSVRNLVLDPLLDGLAGRIGARFAAAYRSTGFEIAVDELTGEIGGRPVAGRGRVQGVSADWQAEGVELALGDNRGAFDGSWKSGVLAVTGRIDAPALEQAGFGVSGALAAELELAGQWPALEGAAQVRSPRLAVGEFALQGLDATARFDDGVLTGSLGAARLGAGSTVLEGLSLTLAGPPRDVDWRLAWAAGEGRGRLRQSAQGLRLEVAALAADAAGRRFALEAPASVLRETSGAIVASPVCIAGDGARACINTFTLDGGRIGTAGELARVPLGLLGDLLPAGLDEHGFLEGRWELAGAGNAWTGTAGLAARGLRIVLSDGDDEGLDLPDAELGARFDGAGVDVTLRAEGSRARVQGSARLAPLAAAGVVSGAVTLTADDLGWLRAFDQRITDLGGAVDGRLTLAGSAAAPVVEGVVELRGGRIALEDPGIRLERIEAAAHIDRNGAFELSGRAVQLEGATERGYVELGGRGSGLYGGALALEATLRGERLRATHPQWEVEVAPDLKLTWAEGLGRLTGLVEVPRAEVRFKSLPANVPRPSADVIVVGREVPPVAAAPLNRLRMNVRVRLGREVSLRALGIQAQLRGELNVRRDARGQASVRGTLDVTGGLLSAQGQTLKIESGTVVYNGPVGNPYIDVRAVREIADQTPPVKVGLRIQGNVNRLTSTVFSEPAMAENRALAFLVLGRDIDQQSETDSNQLLTAAINLGLSQSKSLTSELQRISGLDELSAVAEAEDSFAIAAGKRIGESIFLRYTYNTLSAAGTVLISFDLTRRWRVEALSGESSAVDILYRIDR